jgi:hypothetical protein
MNNQSFGANHPHSRQLTTQQKLGVAVLSLFAVAIFVFWYVELQSSIAYLPYGGVNPAQLAPTSQTASSTGTATVDTDGDGLTDADELGRYRTSPYLADTDGDSLSDSQELADGSDPNCPQGTTCNNGGLYNANESTKTATVSSTNLFSLDGQSGQTLQQAFGANPDPTTLRATLLLSASSEDKQMINSLTDDQLLELYRSMLNSIPSQ